MEKLSKNIIDDKIISKTYYNEDDNKYNRVNDEVDETIPHNINNKDKIKDINSKNINNNCNNGAILSRTNPTNFNINHNKPNNSSRLIKNNLFNVKSQIKLKPESYTNTKSTLEIDFYTFFLDTVINISGNGNAFKDSSNLKDFPILDFDEVLMRVDKRKRKLLDQRNHSNSNLVVYVQEKNLTNEKIMRKTNNKERILIKTIFSRIAFKELSLSFEEFNSDVMLLLMEIFGDSSNIIDYRYKKFPFRINLKIFDDSLEEDFAVSLDNKIIPNVKQLDLNFKKILNISNDGNKLNYNTENTKSNQFNSNNNIKYKKLLLKKFIKLIEPYLKELDHNISYIDSYISVSNIEVVKRIIKKNKNCQNEIENNVEEELNSDSIVKLNEYLMSSNNKNINKKGYKESLQQYTKSLNSNNIHQITESKLSNNINSSVSSNKTIDLSSTEVFTKTQANSSFSSIKRTAIINDYCYDIILPPKSKYTNPCDIIQKDEENKNEYKTILKSLKSTHKNIIIENKQYNEQSMDYNNLKNNDLGAETNDSLILPPSYRPKINQHTVDLLNNNSNNNSVNTNDNEINDDANTNLNINNTITYQTPLSKYEHVRQTFENLIYNNMNKQKEIKHFEINYNYFNIKQPLILYKLISELTIPMLEINLSGAHCHKDVFLTPIIDNINILQTRKLIFHKFQGTAYRASERTLLSLLSLSWNKNYKTRILETIEGFYHEELDCYVELAIKNIDKIDKSKLVFIKSYCINLEDYFLYSFPSDIYISEFRLKDLNDYSVVETAIKILIKNRVRVGKMTLKCSMLKMSLLVEYLEFNKGIELLDLIGEIDYDEVVLNKNNINSIDSNGFLAETNSEQTQVKINVNEIKSNKNKYFSNNSNTCNASNTSNKIDKINIEKLILEQKLIDNKIIFVYLSLIFEIKKLELYSYNYHNQKTLLTMFKLLQLGYFLNLEELNYDYLTVDGVNEIINYYNKRERYLNYLQSKNSDDIILTSTTPSLINTKLSKLNFYIWRYEKKQLKGIPKLKYITAYTDISVSIKFFQKLLKNNSRDYLYLTTYCNLNSLSSLVECNSNLCYNFNICKITKKTIELLITRLTELSQYQKNKYSFIKYPTSQIRLLVFSEVKFSNNALNSLFYGLKNYNTDLKCIKFPKTQIGISDVRNLVEALLYNKSNSNIIKMCINLKKSDVVKAQLMRCVKILRKKRTDFFLSIDIYDTESNWKNDCEDDNESEESRGDEGFCYYSDESNQESRKMKNEVLNNKNSIDNNDIKNINEIAMDNMTKIVDSCYNNYLLKNVSNNVDRSSYSSNSGGLINFDSDSNNNKLRQSNNSIISENNNSFNDYMSKYNDENKKDYYDDNEFSSSQESISVKYKSDINDLDLESEEDSYCDNDNLNANDTFDDENSNDEDKSTSDKEKAINYIKNKYSKYADLDDLDSE